VLVEQVELTLAHVDLGRLTEVAAMTLFGIAHAHRITAGTGNTIRGITDATGALLYPAYYWTHLRVPPDRLLGQHQVWDKIAIGVDAYRHGGTLLASSYVLARPGELDNHASVDELPQLPSLRAGSMFFSDSDGDPKPGTPKRGLVADLESLTAPPPSLQRFRAVRDDASIDTAFFDTLGAPKTISYPLRVGHEIHGDHSVMFARYAGITDAIERELLIHHVWPPFPIALADCLEVLDRETCFFANVRGEQVVRAGIRARLEPCPPGLDVADPELVATAILHSVIEVYDEANVLLVTTKAKKLLVVPSAQQRLVAWAARAVVTHAERSP
jgi:probable biosynthetic protein (TIGR04098 family)